MNRGLTVALCALALCPVALCPRVATAQNADAQAASEQGSEEPAGAALKEGATATDSIPGSRRHPGLSLSPEAPPVPPAPGGRAPSFHAPGKKREWQFTVGASISGWESVGIGSREGATDDQHSTTLHTSPRTEGRAPVYIADSVDLRFEYGNQVIKAYTRLTIGSSGKDAQGYYRPGAGPFINDAYLTITPEPFGKLSLQIRAGGFSEIYGAAGQWNWGVFGPTLGVKGYGERLGFEYEVSPDLRLDWSHGILGVPGEDETYVRGTFANWNETGASTILHHAHVGFNYKWKYYGGLHYASARGVDERRYLTEVDDPHDGTMNVYAADLHWLPEPYGHLGLSFALYDFNEARAVNSGIWWGIDWTQGSIDMMRKHITTIGPATRGTGDVMSLGFEWDASVSRILWYPKPFDGNHPDIQVHAAGLYHRTLDTEDPVFEDADGYMLGLELDYRILPWFSTTLRSYGQARDMELGLYRVFSVSPGLAFRSDWQSTDRIELVYTRYFYNDVVDRNPAAPLDRNVITFGGSMTF